MQDDDDVLPMWTVVVMTGKVVHHFSSGEDASMRGVRNDASNTTETSIMESSLPTKSTGEAVDSSKPGNG